MFLQRLYVGRSKGTYIGGDTFLWDYRILLLTRTVGLILI